MTEPNLNPDELAAVTRALHDTIAADRFPLSPRVRMLEICAGQARSSAAAGGRAIAAADAMGQQHNWTAEAGQAMSSSGAVTLGDIAGKVAMLEIECADCNRYGRYRVDRLIEQHGANLGLPYLREMLPRHQRLGLACALCDQGDSNEYRAVSKWVTERIKRDATTLVSQKKLKESGTTFRGFTHAPVNTKPAHTDTGTPC